MKNDIFPFVEIYCLRFSFSRNTYDPSRICTVEWARPVNMYYSSPIRLAKSNMEKANFCHFSNVVCDGS